MKDLVKIYDKSFAEVGVCGNFISLEHTDCFREAGKAELVIPEDSPAAELIAPDGYIRVPGGGMYIITAAEGDLRSGEMHVSCKGLLSLFARTVLAEEYSLSGNAHVLLRALARKGAANLPAAFSLISETDGSMVDFESGRSCLYDDMVSLCYLGDSGMKLEYSGGALAFSAREARDRTAGSDIPVLMSDRFGTLEAERYLRDFGSYRNVAVVSGALKETGGRYTTIVRSDGMSMSDDFPDSEYCDRQMLVTFSSPLSGYMIETADGERVLDEARYTKAMRASGAAALAGCRPKMVLYGMTDTDASAVLPGDVINIRSERLGLSAPALTERIVTTYKDGKKTVRTELGAKVIA